MVESHKKLINKISEYGDKSVSERILKDKEMNTILEQIYENMNSLDKDEVFELEELINAYTARGILLAYLSGFKDCINLKKDLEEMLVETKE